MNLRKPFIASMAMVALAIPVTSGAIVTLTAGPVLAKDGKGKGGSDRSRGGKSDRRGGGKSGSKPGSSVRGNSGNGNGNAGNNGNATRQATQSAPAPAPSDSGPTGMHPSELGSMNGAMNANINAVLAHIRNGNTNGPVGALAGLAVADHNAIGAQDIIDRAADHEDLATALQDAGFDSFEDYKAALDAGETSPIPAIDDAKTALGDLTGDLAGDPPSDEDIAAAETALTALSDAEAHILDTWNKSGAASDEDKDALLTALRDRLTADSEAIAGAVEETEAEGAEPDAEDEGDKKPETEASLDPDTQAVLESIKF